MITAVVCVLLLVAVAVAGGFLIGMWLERLRWSQDTETTGFRRVFFPGNISFYVIRRNASKSTRQHVITLLNNERLWDRQ